jgi:excisionase family DNA binding protein
MRIRPLIWGAPLAKKNLSQSAVNPPSPEQGLLTVSQTAAYLCLSTSTIRSWILQRRIPFVKLNKAVRIRRTDIETLIASSVVPAVPYKTVSA